MIKLSRIPFTKEGYEELKKKLETLRGQRPEAVKELSRARELGDLSENGLYKAAKARLSSLDNQIFRIDMTLKLADIVDEATQGVVSIGSSVTVIDKDKEITYEIVGDTEADPSQNMVSQHSPIGSALMRKKIGDEAVLESPSGARRLKVLKVL